MYQVSILLIKIGHPHHMACTIQDRAGNKVGDAQYEKPYRGHVLRVPKEKWDAGLAEQLLRPSLMRSGRWTIRVELEADTEGAEGQLAAELDKVKADLAERDNQIEVLRIHLAEAAAPKLGEGLNLAAEINDATPDEPAQEPAIATPEPETVPEGPEAILAAHKARLTAIGKHAPKYADLMAEVRDQNAVGAGIEIEPLISKQKCVVALLEWYATKPTDDLTRC